jgi:hypothetical protein
MDVSSSTIATYLTCDAVMEFPRLGKVGIWVDMLCGAEPFREVSDLSMMVAAVNTGRLR